MVIVFTKIISKIILISSNIRWFIFMYEILNFADNIVCN
jgi:hypothetical protein